MEQIKNPDSLTLEEAAEEYSEGIIGREDAFMCKAAFIAGAEWQAAQLLQGAPIRAEGKTDSD